ncbi:MAG: polyamine aminopropyltransferase [Candidatus Binataceae bacterium]
MASRATGSSRPREAGAEDVRSIPAGEYRGRYFVTIFIGAFLLFQIEPMIAKYILPWFGGSPAVWTTCLLFFQIILLAGYLYAHLIVSKLRPSIQLIVHLGLIGICVIVMTMLAIWSKSPILPGAGWKAARVHFPILRILIVLSASIGLPYFVLSATAPLLQSWFTLSHPGRSPYRLYAVSNFGSLLGLLTYPFAVEPNLGLRAQANLWFVAYIAFAIGLAFCAMPLRRAGPGKAEHEDGPAAASSRGIMALWIALPACASLLLYGATGQMTQDLAPIPFLWILPLGLYLFSFILCFDSDRWYRREIFQPLLGAAILSNLIQVIFIDRISSAVGSVVLSPTAVRMAVEVANEMMLMFAGCMVCHGELVRLRPHRRGLTSFYLMLSAGGAVGGIFSVMLAPILFREFVDFRFATWTCVVLVTISLMRDRGSWIHREKPWVAPAITTAALSLPILIGSIDHPVLYAAFAIGAVTAVARSGRWKNGPRWLAQPGGAAQGAMVVAAAVIAVVYLQMIAFTTRNALWVSRNFYGVLRVLEDQAPNRDWVSHKLMNGQIEHGMQFFSSRYPQLRYYPTGYWGVDSGIGLIMMNDPQRMRPGNSGMRVGVVGLGVGAMAAWGRPGDYFRFYEINPAVIDVATSVDAYFTFLRDSSAQVKIVAGDARLSMESELAEGHAQNFDVLVIDAFTGDMIPTHLLTLQAIRIYLRELKPNGVLAVHVSNLNFDLRPVLAEHSRTLNLHYGFVHNDEKDMVNWSADWVLLTRADNVLGQPAIAAHMESRARLRRIRPWTDDYSNLFQILK